jgi:hypothetical protein
LLSSTKRETENLIKLRQESLKILGRIKEPGVLSGMLDKNRFKISLGQPRDIFMGVQLSSVFTGSPFGNMKGKGKLPPFIFQPSFRTPEDLFCGIHKGLAEWDWA